MLLSSDTTTANRAIAAYPLTRNELLFLFIQSNQLRLHISSKLRLQQRSPWHPFTVLLTYSEDVLRRHTSALNLGNLGVRKIAAYQNKRRCDIVKVKITQVRHVLAATEHTE